jgi:predicted amidophosphoribosyltransferase
VSAAWAYEGAARALILALKLKGLRRAAGPLVEGMAEAAYGAGLQGTVVTWVPGHRPDIRARGFDHAEVLGRGLAGRVGLTPSPLLRRQIAARDQTTLSARDRALNVRGAFVSAPAPPVVVLVDDLITTGATGEACATALRAAGAKRVELVVAARA